MKELNNSEIKSLLLDILKEIDAFCSENKLTYYLAYGTLLGAVRHSGFIPWDDDIDICMPRPDYEKFIETFKTADSRYQVVSYVKDRNYPFFFAKVHDTNTVLKMKTTFKYELGLYVDVFPIDAVPIDKKLQKKYIRKFNFYRNIYNIKSIKYRRGRGMLKNSFLIVSRLITSFVSWTFLSRKIDEISRTYNYSDFKLISIAAVTDRRLFFYKELFSDCIKLKFEDMEACVPKGYIEILTKNYGDYLKLPPKERQISHHGYIAYKIS